MAAVAATADSCAFDPLCASFYASFYAYAGGTIVCRMWDCICKVKILISKPRPWKRLTGRYSKSFYLFLRSSNGMVLNIRNHITYALATEKSDSGRLNFYLTVSRIL